MIKYAIGDKFRVNDIDCEVRYINHGKAWVFPVKETHGANGRVYLTCTAYDILDDRGRDTQGIKALSLNNKKSVAV